MVNKEKLLSMSEDMRLFQASILLIPATAVRFSFRLRVGLDSECMMGAL